MIRKEEKWEKDKNGYGVVMVASGDGTTLERVHYQAVAEVQVRFLTVIYNIYLGDGGSIFAAMAMAISFGATITLS